MATYGEFASLLQLGFGTGIGLSLFRAPVDLRVGYITRVLDGEIAALRGVATEFGRTKRRDLFDLRLCFVSIRAKLDRLQIPFMILAVIGAILNLLGLIKATLDAQACVGTGATIILLLVTIGWFLLILVALELLARYYLTGIQRRLKAIQVRRAVPMHVPAIPNWFR